MANLWRQFEALLSDAPLLLGTVVSTDLTGTLVVQLLGGGLARANGVAAIGTHVFVRAGEVVGPAPELPTIEIEI